MSGPERDAAADTSEPPPHPDIGPSPRRRLGGRSAQVTRRVHHAVQQLLVEGDGAPPTIAAIAERSGVHYSTIYRRWGDAAVLQAEVALEITSEQLRIVDTGALSTDLLAFARQAVVFIGSPIGRSLIRSLLVVDADRRRAFWQQRFEAVRPPFDRAIARGEPVDGSRVIEALENFTGALYFRVLFSGEIIDADNADDADDTARRIVEVALRTVGAPVPIGWRRRPVHRPTPMRQRPTA